MTSAQALAKLIPLFSAHRWGITICVGLLAVVTALLIIKGLLIRHAIDSNMANRDLNGLMITVAALLLTQGGLLTATYLQRLRLERIGQKIIAELKERLFAKTLSLSLSFFDRNTPGRLMARVESDTDSLRLLFTFAITVIVGDFIMLAGIFTTMIIIAPRLALIVTIGVPLAAALTIIYEKITTSRFLESRKRMADLTSAITEFLQSIPVVQIFNRTAYARASVLQFNRAKFKLDRVVHIASTTYFNIIFFLEAVLIVTVLILGGSWLSQGLVTIGVIVMFIQFLRKMFEPIYRFADELYVVQKALAGIRRIYELLDTDEIIPQLESPKQINRQSNGFKGRVKFENVWFSYTGDDNYALKDISFELQPGKRLALVGVTGGGKSSIVNLMLRFYDPQRGRITIDGIDIRQMSKDQLRGIYGLVLQDIYLFPGDIASNISLDSDEISAEKIRLAAQTVGADRFINNMPGGYQAKVSEKGSNLSRGERQLLSFARALVFDPQILALDEATSSVDPETERLIQAALSKLLANRTTLVVAHRLSTILSCDEILVIKDGEIIERGTHRELTDRGGYYFDLFRLQFPENGNNAGKVSAKSGDDLPEQEVSRV